jgi:hypothetical protein
MRLTPIVRFVSLVPALLLLSCVVETDRDRYAVGDVGTVSFHNRLSSTAYLDGCSVFAFQRLKGDAWHDRGPGVVCVWEGFARPVEPGESVHIEFFAPDEPGVWRLRVDVGLGCSPDGPLSREACSRLFAAHSEPFEVQSLCEPRECGPMLGMPNILCSDGESVGGPTDRCLRDLETGSCGWEIASCPEDAPL